MDFLFAIELVCDRAIETLPLIDNTNLFGLHPNADIAFRTRQVTY